MKGVVALAAVALLLGARAEAATISVVPGSQTIAVGANASVDIVVSGLAAGETVGGYVFDLSFVDAILDATAVSIDPSGAMGAGADTFFTEADPTDASPIRINVLSDLLLDEAQLKALQGTGFILASITFSGLTEGLSALALSSPGGFLSNFEGTALIPANAVNGSVCVDDPQTPGDRCAVTPVPEPASMLLLGSGLAGLVAVRRRRQNTAQA